MEETCSNVIAHDNVLAESINHHESWGSRNDLVPSHGEANDSITPPTDTVSEQVYDVITPAGISNNMQMLNGPRVSSRGRMQKLSRKCQKWL